MAYKCPNCDMESETPKDCDMCKMPMEEKCDKCGEVKSKCTCPKE